MKYVIQYYVALHMWLLYRRAWDKFLFIIEIIKQWIIRLYGWPICVLAVAIEATLLKEAFILYTTGNSTNGKIKQKIFNAKFSVVFNELNAYTTV